MITFHDVVEKMEKKTDLGREFMENIHIINNERTLAFAMFVMLERRKDPKSKDRDYPEIVDALPRVVKEFPLVYTEEELNYLKGSFSKVLIYRDIQDMYKEYLSYCEDMTDFKEFPFKEYLEVM